MKASVFTLIRSYFIIDPKTTDKLELLSTYSARSHPHLDITVKVIRMHLSLVWVPPYTYVLP